MQEAEVLMLEREHGGRGELLQFEGFGNKDVYNPAVVDIHGKRVMVGRWESRNNQTDSDVGFGIVNDTTVTRLEGISLEKPDRLTYEDPRMTFIKGEIVLGVVRVDWNPKGKHGSGDTRYDALGTLFFRGKTLEELRPFTEGPPEMKDICLIDLGEQGIGFYGRPHPDITFGRIGSLDDLKAKAIDAAPVLKGLRDPGDPEWVGGNVAYRWDEQTNLLLFHRGSKDSAGVVDYRAEWVLHNFVTGEVSEPQVLATRDDFEDGPVKETPPGLQNIAFPSALLTDFDGPFLKDFRGMFDLYAGLSDASVGVKRIPSGLFVASSKRLAA